MHIVEIPSFFPPYGGEFCLEQSHALMARGHRVTIIACVQMSIKRSVKDFVFFPFSTEKEEIEGVIVERRFLRGIPRVPRLNERRWVTAVMKMFDAYVVREGLPDIIHAHCAKWAGRAAMEISRKYDVPFVITEHLSADVFKTEFAPGSDAWQIPMLREAYENADMVVPVSEELVDNLSPYFGTDYHWKAISNTVDTDFFAFKERRHEDGRTFTFCCLANFWPLKRYDILFEAFSKMPDNVNLVVAGRGTDSQAFKDLLAGYACAKRVKMLGRIEKEEVRSLLYRSDCLVLASQSEAQPLSLVEAMSTGIPVIATDIIPKSISRFEGCHIVPVNDAEALAAEMKAVSEGTCIDGKALSEDIARNFSPEIIGKELENLFLQIHNSRS